MLGNVVLVAIYVCAIALGLALVFWPIESPKFRREPVPEYAIMVPRNDGSPYLHIWRDPQSSRIKMRFASCPSMTIAWDVKVNAGLADALKQLDS